MKSDLDCMCWSLKGEESLIVFPLVLLEERLWNLIDILLIFRHLPIDVYVRWNANTSKILYENTSKSFAAL